MTVLYLGTDPSRYPHKTNLIHFPLIQIRPREISKEALSALKSATHVLVTSPNTAHLLQEFFSGQHLLAIGGGTKAVLESYGQEVQSVAALESQEGMMELLDHLVLDGAFLFYPRSSIARPKLKEYLETRGFAHYVCDLYDTVFKRPQEEIDFREVAEIIFTSPSIVRAFKELYGDIPEGVKCTCIGPITAEELYRGSGDMAQLTMRPREL